MRKCLLCGSKILDKPLMVFDNMPASAQDIPDKEMINSECGVNLSLYECDRCGLVQFDCEPVEYYKDVIRSGGYSTTMKEIRQKQYKYLIEKYHLENKKFIEIGCGRGEFLNFLKEFPVKVYGIENRKQLVDIAVENGLNVLQGFVGNEDIVLKNEPFDVFLSFNFLEHQPDPNGMLRGIYNNLSDDGIGLITVPSVEYIFENDSYYEFLRDHLAYYSFDTLRFALEKNGFEVLEQEMINRDTISMIVKKRKKICVDKMKLLIGEINKEVCDYIDIHTLQNKKVALWGASHQGFTLAAQANLSDKVSYIIDSADFKQGKYAPASHIPIISPKEAMDDAPDAIIVIAPGYTDEIVGIIEKEFKDGTEIAYLKSNHLQIHK